MRVRRYETKNYMKLLRKQITDLENKLGYELLHIEKTLNSFQNAIDREYSDTYDRVREIHQDSWETCYLCKETHRWNTEVVLRDWNLPDWKRTVWVCDGCFYGNVIWCNVGEDDEEK